MELYWASLLRDVAFTTYPASSEAMRAAAELSSMPAYAGPRDAANQVTPELLFRGDLAGENQWREQRVHIGVTKASERALICNIPWG